MGPGAYHEIDDRPICRYFHRGNCHFGMNCRYLHPGVNDLPPPASHPGGPPPISMRIGGPPSHGPPPPQGGGPGWGAPPGPEATGMMGPPPPARGPPSPRSPTPSPKKSPVTESAWERGLRHAKKVCEFLHISLIVLSLNVY